MNIGSILRDDELITLPLEEIFSKVTGVWNLSAEQGNLGTLYLTNVRLVWHANLANNFNVSLPYWQIVSYQDKINDIVYLHFYIAESHSSS